MLHFVHGDLLDSRCTYICHQVNCQGVMGSGVARQIRHRWNGVFDSYQSVLLANMRNGHPSEFMLGEIQPCPIGQNQYIVNMFAQDKYGKDGKKYTSYDAFWDCLNRLKSQLKEGDTVAFPQNIGCGLGGGCWEVIQAMIKEVFKDYRVFIYIKE